MSHMVELDLRLQGNVPAPLQVDYVRNLELSDLEFLKAHRGSKPPGLQKLRDSHHKLAMALAEGLDLTQAAAIAGYTINRASIIKADPLFADTVEHYRKTVVRPKVAEFADKLSAFRDDLLDEAIERGPEAYDSPLLARMLALTMDRTGYGPQTRNLNVNVHMDLAAKLESARKRVRPPLAEPGPKPQAPQPGSAPDDSVPPSLSELQEVA